MGRGSLSGEDGCVGVPQDVSTWAGAKDWESWGLDWGLGDGAQIAGEATEVWVPQVDSASRQLQTTVGLLQTGVLGPALSFWPSVYVLGMSWGKLRALITESAPAYICKVSCTL